mgnify:FL=1
MTDDVERPNKRHRTTVNYTIFMNSENDEDEDSSSDFILSEDEESDDESDDESEDEEEEESEDEPKQPSNINIFKNLLNNNLFDATLNTEELKYFKTLDNESQKTLLNKIKEVSEYDNDFIPYRIKIVNTSMPLKYKSIAYNKLNMLNTLEPGGGEYYKQKKWLDAYLKIPFNNYKETPCSIEKNNIQECRNYMKNCKKIMDDCVYGMDDAKSQIIQMIGQWVTNPTTIGQSIAIQGPMGTGKTTLVKEGISKALGRDFEFISLGGVSDGSYLDGHSYTYEGSIWGKIVETLIHCKSMNPVIYFDELDKVSDTAKGEEIIGILTHLTDTSQNSSFTDKYFSEIDLDMSRCLFIFSYNDESKVNPILKDRMFKVQTKGYNNKDKITISNQYLIPAITDRIHFKKGDIIFSDSTIEYIINEYTDKEKGVRNLKRAIETIYSKLNIFRLMGNETLFNNEIKNVEFPCLITTDIIKKLINKNEKNFSHTMMYI